MFLFQPKATLDFSPQTFHETNGYCRKGPSWAHEPALHTNVGDAKGASNNAPLGRNGPDVRLDD